MKKQKRIKKMILAPRDLKKWRDYYDEVKTLHDQDEIDALLIVCADWLTSIGVPRA